jgi:Domain of unknown function (DUF4261)
MDSEKPGPKKLGAAIYLKTRRPLLLADFVSDFRKRWPVDPLVGEGQQGNCASFAVGHVRCAIELRYAPIPRGVTDAALPGSIRHWPQAEEELASHQAQLKIATVLERGMDLGPACALTKILVALLSVTDSIGVCWLNGPVLHSARTFIAIATEMFGVGVPPLILWVGVHWKPKEHIVHTTGMLQFEAPEILLAQQKRPSPELVEYLFEVANYVLTSGKELLDGETMDGPGGVLRIESVRGSDPSRRALVLVPMRSV